MKSISILLSLVTLITPGLTQTFSQTNLGNASTFGALSAKSIENTGPTAVTGSVGVSSLLLTGFPPGTFTGIMKVASSETANAIADATAARNAAMALSPATALSVIGQETTLVPGIYSLEKPVIFEGNQTLDGAGTYVFQIDSSLTADVGATVILKGGALSENIFWTVASNVILQEMVDFKGTIMSAGTITLGEFTAVNGGVYAASALTLVDNKVGLVVPS